MTKRARPSLVSSPSPGLAGRSLILYKFTTCQSGPVMSSATIKTLISSRPPGQPGSPSLPDNDQHFVLRVRCWMGAFRIQNLNDHAWTQIQNQISELVKRLIIFNHNPHLTYSFKRSQKNIIEMLKVRIEITNATFFGRCSFLFFQFFVQAFRALDKTLPTVRSDQLQTETEKLSSWLL